MLFSCTMGVRFWISNVFSMNSPVSADRSASKGVATFLWYTLCRNDNIDSSTFLQLKKYKTVAQIRSIYASGKLEPSLMIRS